MVAITISTIISLVKQSHTPLLDGYQFFRFGVEWGNEAKEVDEEDFQFCEKLREIPHSNDFQNFHEDGKRGFVGVTLRRREHRRA